ncbi:MAG: xylulokinase, partial [Deltaproteobacteria bacterium]|nr:xylulokinase [Deltaproteobacteria bacterium]
MFLGIDIGTSGVKGVLVDREDRVVAQATSVLQTSRPRPLWSEQDPDDWWQATNDVALQLARNSSRAFAALEGVGLTGQMHGATLLDASDQPLRPAILWNDGRSQAECVDLERQVPDARHITGNLAMPGFTAPKLMWVRQHEPEVFSRTAHVLLPKDYVRLCMSGDHATDLSDASGTLWVDVARRCWSEPMLDACGLSIDAMPSLQEGPEITGRLRAQVAERWGCARVPIVAGAGDN